jgi:hypothetical protein
MDMDGFPLDVGVVIEEMGKAYASGKTSCRFA